MNTESILNKIRGLLAMAEGQANENESLQAMALASQLMTKYGIEQDQLKGPKKVSMAGEGDMIDLFKIHHRILAQAVGELFGCKTLNYNKAKKISFVGRPENIEACEVTGVHGTDPSSTAAGCAKRIIQKEDSDYNDVSLELSTAAAQSRDVAPVGLAEPAPVSGPRRRRHCAPAACRGNPDAPAG